MSTARILIVMAMEGEAAAVRQRLGISDRGVSLHRSLSTTLFTRAPSANAAAVGLALNGLDQRSGLAAIGTQPAVISTLLATEIFHPTIVMSAGTAGGFAERGARIGDVVISEGHVAYHDRRIDVPGWDAYGVGSFPVASLPCEPETVGARFGQVSTGNSLDAPAIDRETMARLGTDAKDMEAAAVAEVALQLGVPFLAVKGITDLVDDPESTAAQFNRNLAHTSAQVASVVAGLVSKLAKT